MGQIKQLKDYCDNNPLPRKIKVTGENLNDKFLNIGFLKDFEGMYPPLANECELIAVEFAKWNENYPSHLKYDDKGKYLGLENLIIIFKNKFYGR
jgi:hypothetical protein